LVAANAAAEAQADGPPVSFAGKQIRLFIGFSLPDLAMTPMRGCWRGTWDNIFPAGRAWFR
jgi:hypothetical protein